MFRSLTDYNDRKNMPLSKANIQEAILKVIEQESIVDANIVTVDTFSHTPNTQRKNTNTIFTSKKLDKMEDLVDAVKNLTINNAKQY